MEINQAWNKLCLKMQNALLTKNTRNQFSIFPTDTILKIQKKTIHANKALLCRYRVEMI